eukprot:TRINITY_DN16458_c0_g2_i1.p1 TRINITY_DN16458_c0_g2~~TRINITY_DN16458_c0_g2_i1.p1  ORF type:complete len:296 (-),score=45.85 TRINITY_DN16458_c0_g2_i1:185-1072(-)
MSVLPGAAKARPGCCENLKSGLDSVSKVSSNIGSLSQPSCNIRDFEGNNKNDTYVASATEQIPQDAACSASEASEDSYSSTDSSEWEGLEEMEKPLVPSIIHRYHEETGMAVVDLKLLYEKGLLTKIPRNDEGELSSVGSMGHAAASCTPCLFWSKKQCRKGLACSHCHFRHPEDKKIKLVKPSKQAQQPITVPSATQFDLQHGLGARYHAATESAESQEVPLEREDTDELREQYLAKASRPQDCDNAWQRNCWQPMEAGQQMHVSWLASTRSTSSNEVAQVTSFQYQGRWMQLQ